MEASSTLTEELQRLAELRSRRDITEEEYAEAKRKLLSSYSTPPAAATDVVAEEGGARVFKSSRWSSGNFLFPDRIELSTDGVLFVKRGMFRSNREYISYRSIASIRVKNGVFLSDINIETSGGSQPIFANGLWKSDAREIQNQIRSHQGGLRIDS